MIFSGIVDTVCQKQRCSVNNYNVSMGITLTSAAFFVIFNSLRNYKIKKGK